jgi:hypothetical protein
LKSSIDRLKTSVVAAAACTVTALSVRADDTETFWAMWSAELAATDSSIYSACASGEPFFYNYCMSQSWYDQASYWDSLATPYGQNFYDPDYSCGPDVFNPANQPGCQEFANGFVYFAYLRDQATEARLYWDGQYAMSS